jgi:hypothetical protein
MITNTAVTAVPDFNAALDAFVKATQQALIDHYERNYTRVWAPRLTVERGLKNVRIVANDNSGSSRSVFCFVRIADGAILKAAGWKAPAKHARGSIYVNAGQDAVGIYGANYLR